MKTAIVHFAGLDTDPNGDCLGLRPFWEAVADVIGASFAALAWDDTAARDKFAGIISANAAVYCSGHSHGADALYEALQRIGVPNVLSASILDLAPPWNPGAWMGPDWVKPAIPGISQCFFQRNDAPLAGVKVGCDEIYDVTSWGLRHSTMCADSRVQDRIKNAVLKQHIAALQAAYSPRSNEA